MTAYTNKRTNRGAFAQEDPFVQLRAISKHFGKVRANHEITLDIRPGMIKALLGENGAGKSTLMSILSGRFHQTSGDILVDGTVTKFSSPKDAISAGIGMVYQHFMLVESMTVAQNVLLGQERGFVVHPKEQEKEVAALADTYGLPIDPSAIVSSLSMGEKQRVEILKLLYRDSRVLILDEPTAVLTPAETEQLFEAMWRMADQGKSLVFISHKLKEVMAVADEIAILRKGEIVDEFHESDIPNETVLANRMVGRDIELSLDVQPVELGATVLDVQGLNGDGLEDIALSVRKGEIVAIAGVAGNGQKELVEVICGLCKPEAGDISILGLDWNEFYPRPPRKGRSLAYIPEDRQGLATCKFVDLVDNFLLTTRHSFTTGPFLNRNKAVDTTVDIVEQFNVQPGHIDANAGALSGGNLQKLVIGREFYRQPDIIV
ncbi:MAG: ATP-binding cassette domain-containing protein, partial [Desulfovibrionales bacterium]|nr:ATP-binding cassette domain-containing protein [Desulfovibrionales bacterium]